MPQRRALLLLAAASPALAQPALPPRLTLAEAEYQPTPKGIAMCLSCTLFVRPNLCKQVEGEVSPEGWCKLYDMVD